MKIGMIFECGPQGPDRKVCEYFARQLLPGEIQIESVTLDNKPKLIENCGESAKLLLDMGCDRVLIIWDLHPPWGGKKEKPCRHADRQNIFASLRKAGVSEDRPVYLICITQELEAWLLDKKAIEALLSTPEHPISVKNFKKRDNIQNPKAKLTDIFVKAKGKAGKYSDGIHAIQLAQKIERLDKLAHSSFSFKRFVEKLTKTSS